MDLLTESQLCEWLRVSRSTLYRQRERGLPHTRIGGQVRYDLEQVLEWLERQKHPGVVCSSESCGQALQDGSDDDEQRDE